MRGCSAWRVDRVFSLSGHGTIVTGTVFSGQVRTGDTVCVMPAGTAARVRSLHAQNRAADSGRCGQRCALNLAGLERSAIARGDWLAEPQLLAATRRLDVRLRLLPDSRVRLASWAPLHVHLGTLHRVAHIVLLEATQAPAGGSQRAQLVFDAPVCALPGDRFIVRDAQATHTLGGGVVLDPFAPARRRRSHERHRYLDALEQLIDGRRHQRAPATLARRGAHERPGAPHRAPGGSDCAAAGCRQLPGRQ